MANVLKQAFIGPDGKLRFFWRAVIFYCIGRALLEFVWDRVEPVEGRWLGIALDGLSPVATLLDTFQEFLAVLVPTVIFARYERRRVDSYGLPIHRAFSSFTLEGFAAGVLMAGAVALGMILLGGMHIHGFAAGIGSVVVSGFAWFAANVMIGVAEELWFRSYFQQTLWKSIGFWPASIVIALIFSGEHYFFKTGENIWDVINLMSFSLLISYSMLRTGMLWFGVGLHIAFDYMQFFVIGTPNGAQVPVGRLLNVSFNGPAWLTGGVLGTEASFLMYPAYVLLWIYVWWRYRGRPALEPE
jgi:uncharacterized protein